MKKILAIILSVAVLSSLFIPASSVLAYSFDEISRIEVDAVSVIEHGKGEAARDDYGNEYWYYYGFDPGGYTVYYTNGYFEWNYVYEGININGEWYWLDYDLYEAQQNSHWTVGNTYTVDCSFAGIETVFNVNIIPNPVERIEAENISLIEGTNGYFDYDENDSFWFYHPETTYTVYFNDGRPSKTIYYDRYYDPYVYIEGLCYYIKYDWYGQYESHWTVGNTYTVACSVAGVEGSYNISIVKNPVTAVSVEDVAVIDHAGGEILTDESGNEYYQYYGISPSFTVYFNDGTPSQTSDEEGGVQIYGRWYYLNHSTYETQRQLHWELNGTYAVPCSFIGMESSFNVTVIPNPVSHIVVEDVAVYEFLDSSTEYYGESSYTYYSVSTPRCTVYFNDGTPSQTSVDGVVNIAGYDYYIDYDTSSQQDNPWAVNGTYAVPCWLAGVESSFNVTVLPISAINGYVSRFSSVTLNTPVNANVNRNDVLSRVYKFTPYSDGTYAFESTGNESDPWLKLYDEDFNMVDGDDDGGDSYNFCLETELEAGKTYYLTFYMYNGSRFTFNVTKSAFDCTHSRTELKNRKNATCTAEGYTGDRCCADCGEVLERGSAIPATGHLNTEIRNAKAATCTAEGYTGDTYCKECNTLLSRGNASAALGHNGVWRVTTAPTLTEEGERRNICTNCSKVLDNEIIPALGATYDTDNAIKGETEDISVAAAQNSDLLDTLKVKANIEESTDNSVTYEIHLENNVGEEVQPDAPVLVKIKIPANIDKSKLNIYRLEADGSKTRMKYTIDGDYAYFETDHFSIYELLEKVCGDVSGDGVLNNQDLALLFQVLSNINVTVNTDALDINGDNAQNNKDIARLFQYLSGWNVDIF
ncbi:MAG: hypothetical protein J5659_00200 [Clostridia bacterium]|nr:hypothetical protein [Clostridia bacterium]